MSQPAHYPPGTVRALLTTDHVSNATRQALTERLNQQPGPLRFFSTDEADTLRLLTSRLIPQPADAGFVVDIVGPVDQRLANNEGDGWRYDALPTDQETYQRGLRGVNESAQVLYGQAFGALTEDQQDDLIRQIQAGTAPGDTWQQLPADRFFEETLAELVAVYFSHPIVQEGFGYVGMADKPAWTKIGLNEREAREPNEL